MVFHGDAGRSFDYDVGIFAGDNNGSSRRSNLTAAARLEWEPADDLVLAVHGSEGRLTAVVRGAGILLRPRRFRPPPRPD